MVKINFYCTCGTVVKKISEKKHLKTKKHTKKQMDMWNQKIELPAYYEANLNEVLKSIVYK